MNSNFTNPSRSYDATRQAVHFWGYDGSMEVSFFVAADALRQLRPSTSGEEDAFLGVFDANRQRIHEVAAKVYARRPMGSYDLQASDF